jgi:hypothetical protein
MAPLRKLFVTPGQQIGRGTVIDPDLRIGYDRSHPYGTRAARMSCSCGNEYEGTLSNLLHGLIQSCGCQSREWASELARTYGHLGQPRGAAASVTHGLHGHPLYNTWNMMLHRCENPANKRYAKYGGRGIKVCERWHDVRLFLEDIERDLGQRPAGMTLDRINNDGNYEPGNVRWATDSEQRLNQSRRLPRIERRLQQPTLDDIRSWPPQVSVEPACVALGVGRTKGYRLMRSGLFPIPVTRDRHRYVVATADILRLLETDCRLRKGK